MNTYLGKISFSVYLVHFAVINTLSFIGFSDYLKVDNAFAAIGNYIIRLLVVLTISSIIASVTYKFIEEKFQRVGKGLIKSLNKQSEPTAKV